MTVVYYALGGNIGDALSTQIEALRKIQQIPRVTDLVVSNFYETTPVSPIPQDPFINCACRFNTQLTAEELFAKTEEIERLLGKVPKPKDAPRPIDLDMIAYGTQRYVSDKLQLPHPRWTERLFVLQPLSDLTHNLIIEDEVIQSPAPIANLPPTHTERVVPIHPFSFPGN